MHWDVKTVKPLSDFRIYVLPGIEADLRDSNDQPLLGTLLAALRGCEKIKTYRRDAEIRRGNAEKTNDFKGFLCVPSAPPRLCGVGG